MKLMYPSSLILMAALLVTSPNAFAQAGAGHGGDAVADTGEIIDRVSSGFRLKDFFDADLRDPADKLTSIFTYFQRSDDDDKIALKRDLGKIMQDLPIDSAIQERTVALIGTEDGLLARILAAPFAMYDWERHTNVSYVDDYTSDEDYGRAKTFRYNDGIWRSHGGVHQVGRRINDKIEIAEVVFARMYTLDKVGLLMHEAIYSLFAKAPELPYGQDPNLVRPANADWFKYKLGLTTVNPLETANFEFNKILPQARVLLVPDESLVINYKRGKYYRIEAKKFTIEFKFETYQTQLFETKYLQPKLILK